MDDDDAAEARASSLRESSSWSERWQRWHVRNEDEDCIGGQCLGDQVMSGKEAGLDVATRNEI